jgi:hypothetical protein
MLLFGKGIRTTITRELQVLQQNKKLILLLSSLLGLGAQALLST